MAGISYSASVVREGAEKLYDKAGSIIFIHSLGGLLVGFIAGGVVGKMFFPEILIILWVIISLAGLCIGFLMGQNKAFF